MEEPNIQAQNNKPPTLINSEWVQWASVRIAELEAENKRLREGIEKHKVNRVPEDEQLWALLEQSKSEPIMEDIDVMIRHEYSRNFRTMGE